MNILKQLVGKVAYNAQNLNQFAPGNQKGKVDMDILTYGSIECQVGSGQATALAPGDRLKLSTSSGYIPQVVKANHNEEAFGFVALDPKSSAPVAGDFIRVVPLYTGIILWMTAGATIAAGAEVEQESDGDVITLASGLKMGTAIDPVASGALTRVIINRAKAS